MAAKSIVGAIGTIFQSFGKIPFGLGIPLAFASVAGLMSLIAKGQSVSKAGDMYSPPNGKTQVSTKEGGLFELSKNDTLIAGPMKNKSSSQQQGGVASSEDPVVKELKEIKDILKRTYDLERATSFTNPFTVGGASLDLLMDKLGTKSNVNTYKTQ